MIDLSGNIDHFTVFDLQVLRYEPSTLGADGVWTKPEPAVVPVRANIVPVTGRQLEIMAEGWRTREPIQVFAQSELRTLDEATKAEADRFDYDGKTYEVQQAHNWLHQGGYWVAIALKVEAT